MSVNLSARQFGQPTLVDEHPRHPRARPACRPSGSSWRSPSRVLLDEGEDERGRPAGAARPRRPARPRRLRDRLLVPLVPPPAAARHDQDRPLVHRRARRRRRQPADRPGGHRARPRARDRGRRRGDRDRRPARPGCASSSATAARATTTPGRSRPRRSRRCSPEASRPAPVDRRTGAAAVRGLDVLRHSKRAARAWGTERSLGHSAASVSRSAATSL